MIVPSVACSYQTGDAFSKLVSMNSSPVEFGTIGDVAGVEGGAFTAGLASSAAHTNGADKNVNTHTARVARCREGKMRRWITGLLCFE